MELNTQTPVPEWDNQPVTVMAEDPVYLTDEGWQFFRPRQDAFYLIETVPVSRPAYPDGLYAELWTTKGLISLKLAHEQAPMSVANFVGLAEGTVTNKAVPPGHPFYDGTAFHRVVPGHVIQAGMAKAGETGPGYTFPNEIVPGLGHGRAGMLGMANAGRTQTQVSSMSRSATARTSTGATRSSARCSRASRSSAASRKAMSSATCALCGQGLSRRRSRQTMCRSARWSRLRARA